METTEKIIIGFVLFMIVINMLSCQHDMYQKEICQSKAGEYHRGICVKPEAVIKLN